MAKKSKLMAAKKGKVKRSETPLMKQYNSFKSKYPDAILLFRVGDFYETFGQDAVKASQILGIVLTKRKNGAASEIPLAGFPHHALDTYLPKLVRAGERVAICDQLEDAKLTKTIVKRGVTELVTPGLSTRDNTISHNRNNYLASVYLHKNEGGIAFLDLSTGEFITTQGSFDYIDKLLQSFSPNEVLVEREKKNEFHSLFGDSYYVYYLDDWIFTEDYSRETLTRHFSTISLKGFGIEDLPLGIVASGAALHYLKETQHTEISHINAIARISKENHVWLDRFTIRNLELFYSHNENAKTLLDTIDHCCTPMGSRLMKRWLSLPLKKQEAIEERLNIVEEFVKDDNFRNQVYDLIREVGDLERLISKVALMRITPREVVQLRNSLDRTKPLKELLQKQANVQLKAIADQINPCDHIRERIEKELNPDAPVSLAKGNVISDGVSPDLDELRNILRDSKSFLENLQQAESERSGIPSLKIGFNNVFGYYFEVRNTHKDKVPEEWVRKQTLVNAERYITSELKEYETKILGAEERISELEATLFNDLLIELNKFIAPIQLNARLIAKLDCLLSFASLAGERNYCKPEINTSFELRITGGRHPVIETQLPPGDPYIPNDIFLSNDQQQIMMITGPNMSGKSALLRQTALIVLLAQIGCFVPAEKAEIGIIDKIFTRVGASDNISMGESTFMVEMNETASILNNLSDRSLILLDEIGRGTSTYDGVSIAWAIAEYLHQNKFRPKTMFATHYHELNEMEKHFERIKNYNVSIREAGNRIIFIRKLEPGGSNHSFGIHVASMAGMPPKVINTANEILRMLENKNNTDDTERVLSDKMANDNMQLSLFQLDDPALAEIRRILLETDINTLTPVEALLKLNEIKKKVKA